MASAMRRASGDAGDARSWATTRAKDDFALREVLVKDVTSGADPDQRAVEFEAARGHAPGVERLPKHPEGLQD